MNQLALFDRRELHERLETYIEREGDLLRIPEGVHTTPCTHGIHRFPGKFIPNIPRYLIRNYLAERSPSAVLDPFCGSGTTLVELALERLSFVGMDLDPLSALLSKAKTTPINEESLLELRNDWQHHDYDDASSSLVPQVPNLSHWFTNQAVRELSSIKCRCLGYDEPLKSFSLVVFSSIIRRVSNADDQTQKTYVSGTLPKSPPLPSEVFPLFLERAIKGLIEFSSLVDGRVKGTVLRGDARSDLSHISFSDVLTSPPYIDSIDYMYNQMLEYYWLLPELGLDRYEHFRAARKRPMGFRIDSSEDSRKELKAYLGKDYCVLKALCDFINKTSPKEEKIIYSFFHDFAKHVESVWRVQATGGFYCCVIGNSLIRRVSIPTVDFVSRIFEAHGYRNVDKLEYEIRRHYMKFPRRSNSGKIKKDIILIFERA